MIHMMTNSLINENENEKAKVKVEKGLKGLYVTETDLSSINGIKGILTIRGYPLDELAFKATFEEVVYLLLYNKRISKLELETYKKKLAQYRNLSPFTVEIIKNLVIQNVSAIEVLQIALSTLFNEFNSTKEDKKELIIASFPTIIAYYNRLKNRLEIIKPRDDLGHVENFLYMLEARLAEQKRTRALEIYLITVIDHGMNASTFVSRCIASSDSDLLSSVLGAIGSLKGPKHGGAPGPALELVLEVAKSNDPESYIRELLENGKRLPGFGHRIYKTRDPRADVLKKAGETFYTEKEKDISEIFKKTEQLALKLLNEYKPGRELHTNVEFYTAYLLHGIGMDQELFTSLFSMSRVVGWLAHAEEQQREDLLIRPESLYIGEYGKQWN